MMGSFTLTDSCDLLDRASELVLRLYGGPLPIVACCTRPRHRHGRVPAVMACDTRVGAAGEYKLGANESDHWHDLAGCLRSNWRATGSGPLHQNPGDGFQASSMTERRRSRPRYLECWSETGQGGQARRPRLRVNWPSCRAMPDAYQKSAIANRRWSTHPGEHCHQPNLRN